MIPNSKHLPRDPASPLRIHPAYLRLHLGNESTAPKRRVFRGQYLNTPISNSCLHTHTYQSAIAGIAGVLNGKLIQFQPPSVKYALPG